MTSSDPRDAVSTAATRPLADAPLTPRDARAHDIAVDALHQLALPRARVPIPAKQQQRILRAHGDDHARLGLDQRRQAAELAVRVRLAQVAHLVAKRLDPGPQALELRAGAREAVAHHGLLHQRLAERLALEHVGEGGGERGARLRRDAHRDRQPLMVEVGHDVAHAVALLADEVVDGHAHRVELDVRGAARLGALDGDLAHADARVALEGDEQHGEASGAGPAGADGHGGVVGPDAVGDPLFGAVDDVELAVGGLGGGGLDVGDVAAGVGFGDGDAGALAAGEEVGEEALLQGGAAELEDGGDAVGHAGAEGAGGAGDAATRHLGDVDGGVHVVKVLDLQAAGELAEAEAPQPGGGEGRGQVRDQHVGLGKGGEDGVGDVAGAFEVEGVLREVLGDEGAAGLLPFPVGGVVVGRGEAVDPGVLREGDGGHGGRVVERAPGHVRGGSGGSARWATGWEESASS